MREMKSISQSPIHISSVASDSLRPARADTAVIDRGAPEYDGSYTVTPGAAAQILPVAGYMMRENLTVGPIPHNYGLITWNGSTLTVS